MIYKNGKFLAKVGSNHPQSCVGMSVVALERKFKHNLEKKCQIKTKQLNHKAPPKSLSGKIHTTESSS